MTVDATIYRISYKIIMISGVASYLSRINPHINLYKNFEFMDTICASIYMLHNPPLAIHVIEVGRNSKITGNGVRSSNKAVLSH